MRKLLLAVACTSVLMAGTIELEPIEVTSTYETQEEIYLKSPEYFGNKIIMQETTPGFRQPVVNGFMGDKVLLTVDNITFSNALFRSGPNQYFSYIPEAFIKNISITDGLSDITSNSIGGSINTELGITESKVQSKYNSSNNGYELLGAYTDDKFSVGVNYIKTDNVNDTKEEVQNSAYNQQSFYSSYKSLIGKSTVLYSESNDIDRTDKFAKGDYYIYELQRYININNIYGTRSFNLVTGYQQFREKIDRQSPDTKDVDSTNNIFNIEVAGVRQEVLFDDKLNYGAGVISENINYQTGSVSNDYMYNTYYLSMGYTIYLDNVYIELKDKLTRLDVSKDLDKELTNNSYSVKVGLLLENDSDIYVSFSENYKLPTIVNLAEAKDDSVTEIANPDLTEEKARTYTIGYKSKYVGVKVFHKDLFDFIQRVKTDIPDGSGSYKYKYQNIDTGYLDGINLEYIYIKGKFRIAGYFEYLNGRTDYDYISKLTTISTYHRIDYSIFYTEWKYAPAIPDDKMAEKDTTDIRIQDHNYGYNIINVGYKDTFKKKHILEVTLNNIFNDEGRVYGSSVDFAERHIELAYSYLF